MYWNIKWILEILTQEAQSQNTVGVCFLFVAPSTAEDATINQQPIISVQNLVILHWLSVSKNKERKEKAPIRSADDAKLNSLIHY